jgi:hypothetical protein
VAELVELTIPLIDLYNHFLIFLLLFLITTYDRHMVNFFIHLHYLSLGYSSERLTPYSLTILLLTIVQYMWKSE